MPSGGVGIGPGVDVAVTRDGGQVVLGPPGVTVRSSRSGGRTHRGLTADKVM